jgi:hypothetical protein
VVADRDATVAQLTAQLAELQSRLVCTSMSLCPSRGWYACGFCMRFRVSGVFVVSLCLCVRACALLCVCMCVGVMRM